MKNGRISSIDIIRSLSMLLMIFVNDLFTLTNIPGWLEHKPADYDGMGLADIVFPAFLFIVGLSIPYAVRDRINKGESTKQVLLHIASRSFALILMGVYMVNLENYNTDLWFSKHYWHILMGFAFILIWNNYRGKAFYGIPPIVLKVAGWLILIFLGAIFESNTGGWMETHWWGILGLIGWAYFYCASIYTLAKSKIRWISLATIAFVILNVQEFVPLFGDLRIYLVVSASNSLLVILGVLSTLLLERFLTKHGLTKAMMVLASLAAALFLFGFATRPEWGISKIYATPSWTTICAGITLLGFMLLYLIADLKGKTRWADFLAPAGLSSLTCYLIPDFFYSIFGIMGFTLPEMLSSGGIGLLKSILFAVLVIQITGWIGKIGIALKI